MTEAILRELSNTDINWMIAAGRREEVAAGTILLQPERSIDTAYLILDGTLSVAVSQAENNPLASAFAALGGSESPGREIARLSSGEIVGETSLLNLRPLPAIVKTAENSLLLSIPQQRLSEKLQEDASFAAHFYRAIALMLSNRQGQSLEQLGQGKLAQAQPVKDVLFVFGELHNSDIDWLIDAGKIEKLAPGSLLIQESRPVDALYIILDGLMSVSISEGDRNPLARAFAALGSNDSLEREIAKLSKGEIVGEMPFIDSRPPSTTVKAITETLVLSIPRQQLTAKLQQDVGFASRFYRVLSMLLSERLRGIIGLLGYGRRFYNTEGQQLERNVEYEDKLDLDLLEQVSFAATRFDWMLKQLRVS